MADKHRHVCACRLTPRFTFTPCRRRAPGQLVNRAVEALLLRSSKTQPNVLSFGYQQVRHCTLHCPSQPASQAAPPVPHSPAPPSAAPRSGSGAARAPLSRAARSSRCAAQTR